MRLTVSYTIHTIKQDGQLVGIMFKKTGAAESQLIGNIFKRSYKIKYGEQMEKKTTTGCPEENPEGHHGIGLQSMRHIYQHEQKKFLQT